MGRKGEFAAFTQSRSTCQLKAASQQRRHEHRRRQGAGIRAAGPQTRRRPPQGAGVQPSPDFLKLLAERLIWAGISYQHLDGSTPESERGKRVVGFQRGEGDLCVNGSKISRKDS